MTNDLHKRLTRLESVLGVAEGPAIEDLPKLGSEEFDAALALAAAKPDGEHFSQVNTIPGAVPLEMVGAVEQALILTIAALALGWAKFGFQRDPALSLGGPLAALLPEPRSPAATRSRMDGGHHERPFAPHRPA